MTSTDLSVSDIPYAVHVQFYGFGKWSDGYTYKSFTKYEPNDIVLVPTEHFYSVGKVINCTKAHTFKKNITYRYVICKLDVEVKNG
jgi:hypothetical protein